MVPERRTNESWLPEIFNDFFDNRWMERVNYSAPAINVKENEKEYEVEVAAPGLTKDDFKINLDAEGNLVRAVPSGIRPAGECRHREDFRSHGARRVEHPHPETHPV